MQQKVYRFLIEVSSDPLFMVTYYPMPHDKNHAVVARFQTRHFNHFSGAFETLLYELVL